MRYEDFNIRINNKSGDGYDVSVDSPAGSASEHITLPFDINDAAIHIQQMGGTVRSGTMREAEFEGGDSMSPSDFGSKLYKSLFSGSVGKMYHRSYSALDDPNVGLRIKLHLNLDDPDVSALAQLPWEFAYEEDTRDYLALSRQTPIVRYIEVQRRQKAHSLQGHLRVLVVMSSPKGVHALDLEKERKLIEDSWAGEEDVEVDFLEHPTSDKLLQMLVEKEYHVLHYMGHGAHDANTGAGALVLEDDNGDAVFLDAQTLGTCLRDAPTLRLAFLNACDTARTDEDEPFAGVANRLVMAGLPAVVAMQFPISDEAAIDFARAFYPRLVAGFPVDEATAQGRKAILAGNPGSMEWGTPVLYMRAPDGRLFDIPDAVQAPEQTAKSDPPPVAPADATKATPEPAASAPGGIGLKAGIGGVAVAAVAALAFLFFPKGDDIFRWGPDDVASLDLEVGVPEKVSLQLYKGKNESGDELLSPYSLRYQVAIHNEGDLKVERADEKRWEWRVTANDPGAAKINATITPTDSDEDPISKTLDFKVIVNEEIQSRFDSAIASIKDTGIASSAVKAELEKLNEPKNLKKLSGDMKTQLNRELTGVQELVVMAASNEPVWADPNATLTNKIAALDAWKTKFKEVRASFDEDSPDPLNKLLIDLKSRTNIDKVILCGSYKGCNTSIARLKANTGMFVSVEPPTTDVKCEIKGPQTKPCRMGNSNRQLNLKGTYTVVITNKDGDLLATSDIESY